VHTRIDKPVNSVNINLQILRGISIIGVLAFHVLSGKFPNGYFGVDIFFFISGFLIFPRAAEAWYSKDFIKYYRKRFLRIVPPLAIMLISMAPLVLLLGSWSSHITYLRFSLFALIGLGNVGAFILNGNYFDESKFLPLVHIWSLGVEIQVYLIVPFLNFFRKNILIILFSLSFVIYLIQFVDHSLQDFIFYFFISRIWEFMLGAFAGKFNFRFQLNPTWHMGIIALLLVLLLGPQVTPLLVALIGFALVILSTRAEITMKNFTPFNLLLKLGDRSYSIYLYHMPILYLAKYSPIFFGTDRKIETILSILIIFIFSELSYKFVEGRYRGI
jgi:peptidoglycan/LPS O-acetylase OafA/YrhL